MSALLVILAGSVFAPHCSAQAVAIAQVSGVVSDPSGSPLAGAQLKITQTDTQLVRNVTADVQGRYTFPNLPVGPYTLEVTASGFKTYTQSGIVLQVGNNVTLNVTMQIGSVAEHIEVSAQAGMVETKDNTVSQVIDERRIVDLPLNGRQPTQLILLSGAAVTTPAGDMRGSKNFYSSTTISVAGGQANSVNYLLDGGDNNDSFTNVNLPIPFPDALQEFSVQTSSLPARFGLHPGAVVNAVTKSGTNDWHGSAFEFLRNGAVNARNTFSASHDTLKRNQFGGTFGGRIIRDKLFFFGGFQGQYNRQEPTSTISYVPTAATLAGDFSTILSSTCVSGGKSKSLIDPTSNIAFPDNQIPVTRLNQQALNLVKYLPAAQTECGKVTYGIPQTGDEDQGIARIDWTINSKQTLYGRYFIDDYRNPSVFDGENLLTTTRAGNLQRVQTLTLGHTYTLSPTTINAFHATVSRRRNDRGAPANDINFSDLGVNVSTPVDNFIYASVSSYFSVGCGTCANAKFNVNSIHLSDDVDVIRGKHQIAFGVDYVRNQFNSINIWNSNGNFTFNGQYASGKTTNDALGAFLLGVPNDFTQSANLQNATRGTIFALYVQDSIRLSSHLTINGGLRWDPTLVPYDYFDRGTSFSKALFDSGTVSSVYTGAPAGLMFYGDSGIPRGFQHNHLFNLSPRVGLVFDPGGDGKQTIRVSSAILRDTEEMFYNERLTTNSPYGTSIDVTYPSGGFTDPWSGYSGGNPFPLPSPIPSNYTFPTSGVYVDLPLDLAPTYMLQWNVSYQRQLTPNWLASVSYLGNKTTHVWGGEDINPAVYDGTSTSTDKRRLLYRQDATKGQYYSSITRSDQYGNSNYNGLLLSIQHRFAKGFTLLTNYTWSHCVSDMDFTSELAGSSYMNPYDRSMDRGNCNYDVRHQTNTSLVVQTPVRGSGWMSKLLGNWQLAPIVTYHSGLPFSVTAGTDVSQEGLTSDRPNQTLADAYYPNATDSRYWLNRSAFTVQTTGTYGNMGRDTLVAPATVNVDASFSRTFAFHERWRLEARFEAFNVFNHPVYSSPTTTLSSSTFGVISSASDPRILQFALKLKF